MIYEGIECLIRVGLGRNEWAIVIYFPDANDPFARSVVTFQGTREEANSVARQRIRNWLKRQTLKSGHCNVAHGSSVKR